jgi:hypothetical protein
MKLGKTPARAEAVSFRFADFFDATAFPKPPPTFGHQAAVTKFYGLGNDTYSNCVWAGAAHETMIWSLAGGRDRAHFTIHSVLSDYTAVTGFDPHKPDTDNGTDMELAAAYRRKTGVLDATGRRHKIDSYLSLRIGGVEELFLAMWLTGAAGIGLQLPAQAQDAFDHKQIWRVPKKPVREGGHYVSGCGRDQDGNILIVTWGQVARMSPEFYMEYNDENVVYVSLELFNDKNLTPEGFDVDKLRAHLAKLKDA